MNIRPMFLAVSLFFVPPAHAQTSAVVLAASATSSAPGSSPVACLLDPNCIGYWSPGSVDSGIDEGIYVQFEDPAAVDFIDLKFEEPNISPYDIQVYLNGKTQGKNGIYWIAEQPESAGMGFRIGAGREIAPLKEKIKSFFLKLDRSPEAGNSKGFRLWRVGFISDQGSVLPLSLPQQVPAVVSATSILEPVSAYHPAHLVDSKYDMAWSTDGKKVSGKGESVTFSFSTPQTLSGMIVWNGYQRSDTHFSANGRVSELEVKHDGGAVQTVKLQDKMGAQKATFSAPISGASQVILTLKGIIPGSQYKDVLISELRFLDGKGGMILPTAALPKAVAPAGFAGLVNRSYAAFLHQPMAADDPEATWGALCDNSRLRLREDGSFVIYKGFDYGKPDSVEKPANVDANVLEGNWEPKGDKIRIFGRQYVTALRQSEYLQGAKPAAPRAAIFQSELSIKPYVQLTREEKQTLFAYLWTKKKGAAGKNRPLIWPVNVLGPPEVTGADYGELVKKLDEALSPLNPYYLQSSVVNDLFLPADKTSECYGGVP